MRETTKECEVGNETKTSVAVDVLGISVRSDIAFLLGILCYNKVKRRKYTNAVTQPTACRNGTQRAMTNARILHEKAMSLASQALVASYEDRLDEVHSFYTQAYKLDAEAADLVAKTQHEPTRSILYRSAAALALECSAFEDVERLVSCGLRGYPPSEIAEELREIREKALFRKALKERETDLDAKELQMILSGVDTQDVCG